MQVRGALDFPHTTRKSGCLYKLCITPYTHRAVHIDCTILMPSPQSICMGYLDSPEATLKAACAGSSCGDLQQMCMVLEKVNVQATIAVQQ